jgi:hypothetical protein
MSEDSGEFSKPQNATEDNDAGFLQRHKDKLKGVAAAGIAAVALGGPLASAAHAEAATPEDKPATGISQTASESHSHDPITKDKAGHVTEINRGSYHIKTVDNDTVTITGRDKGLEELAADGILIKKVEGQKGNRTVEVDDTTKLSRSENLDGRRTDSEKIKENGKIVGATDEEGSFITSVDDDTLTVVGHDSGMYPPDVHTKESLKGLGSLLDINIKKVEAPNIPGNEDKHILNVDFDKKPGGK